jgi:hypothetical protein
MEVVIGSLRVASAVRIETADPVSTGNLLANARAKDTSRDN